MYNAKIVQRAAKAFEACIKRIDPRVLVAFITLMGIFAWIAPVMLLLPCFVLALCCMGTAVIRMPQGRTAISVYLTFVTFWAISMMVLYLFENPGDFALAEMKALLFGVRLITLLGLAMIVPLNATPVVLGRVLNWYCQWPGRVEVAVRRACRASRTEPVLTCHVWKAGLALTLMMALLPRAGRALSSVKGSLNRRARHLSLPRRVLIMGVAALRILSAQTWAMTLSIASRDLYRPDPWAWKEKAC